MNSQKSQPPRIIVHADDLGMNVGVNAAIERALDEGMVTSVSIMANGAAFADGIRVLRGRVGVSVGVHLNATQFAPLTRGANMRVFCDEAGFFRLPPKRWLTSAERRALADEWCAQVCMVREQGVKVSHFDSHHHVHTLPMLFPVLKCVQARCGVQIVRNTANMPVPRTSGLRVLPKRLAKTIWCGALKLARPHTVCTDLFGSVTDFVAASSACGPGWAASRTVEVMCHPGHPGDEYQQEMRVLKSGMLSVTGVNGIPITYWDL